MRAGGFRFMTWYHMTWHDQTQAHSPCSLRSFSRWPSTVHSTGPAGARWVLTSADVRSHFALPLTGFRYDLVSLSIISHDQTQAHSLRFTRSFASGWRSRTRRI